jgi:DNA-binding Xre family transcriptional regulator
MPIRIRLDRVLFERRMSLAELADRVGVTPANLTLLKAGEAQAIRFSTLDALVLRPASRLDGRGLRSRHRSALQGAEFRDSLAG